MEEDSSPKQALRGFRIQKKPQLSHQSSETLDSCKLEPCEVRITPLK